MLRVLRGRVPSVRQAARLSRQARHLKGGDDAPIAFSKTKASQTSIQDTLGLPKEKENVRGPYISLAFGVLLCGTMVYKFLTTDADTKRHYFQQELFTPPPEMPQAPGGQAQGTDSNLSGQ